MRRTRDFPKFIMRPPPICDCCIMKNQNPMSRAIGISEVSIACHHGGSGGFSGAVSMMYAAGLAAFVLM